MMSQSREDGVPEFVDLLPASVHHTSDDRSQNGRMRHVCRVTSQESVPVTS